MPEVAKLGAGGGKGAIGHTHAGMIAVTQHKGMWWQAQAQGTTTNPTPGEGHMGA